MKITAESTINFCSDKSLKFKSKGRIYVNVDPNCRENSGAIYTFTKFELILLVKPMILDNVVLNHNHHDAFPHINSHFFT